MPRLGATYLHFHLGKNFLKDFELTSSERVDLTFRPLPTLTFVQYGPVEGSHVSSIHKLEEGATDPKALGTISSNHHS